MRAQAKTMELTPAEAETIRWAADGKVADDIAVIMGRSPKTIHYRLLTAKDKLGAANTANLVAIALRRGIIE